MDHANMETVDILIVGAGISGLALGYFLQQIPCKIIERDTDLNGKRQEFSLTLQYNTKNILSEYGLLDEFYK